MLVNPFKPTAGASPPLLVGRDGVLEEIDESLDDGPGAPARLVRFSGARGIGKTVMLTETRALANRRGWISISETATPGLVDRIAASARRAERELDVAPRVSRRVTGFTLPAVLGTGGGGSDFGPSEESESDVRVRLNSLLDRLEPHETGVLITIDEIQPGARAELRRLASVFQHLVTDQREVALAVAGLPSAVSDLLQDDVLTFLRRATPFDLVDVPLDDVRAAFSTTIAEGGRSITHDALEAATLATDGYPFMIQLVGYHVWRKASGEVIDMDAVIAGVPAARKRLGATVHAAALDDLSEVDRTVLLAMSQDDGPSLVGALAGRLHESAQYISVYRRRLLDAGVIHEAGYGRIDFALPYLREYLREHAARYQMSGRRPRRSGAGSDGARSDRSRSRDS